MDHLPSSKDLSMARWGRDQIKKVEEIQRIWNTCRSRGRGWEIWGQSSRSTWYAERTDHELHMLNILETCGNDRSRQIWLDYIAAVYILYVLSIWPSTTDGLEPPTLQLPGCTVYSVPGNCLVQEDYSLFEGAMADLINNLNFELVKYFLERDF